MEWILQFQQLNCYHSWQSLHTDKNCLGPTSKLVVYLFDINFPPIPTTKIIILLIYMLVMFVLYNTVRLAIILAKNSGNNARY